VLSCAVLCRAVLYVVCFAVLLGRLFAHNCYNVVIVIEDGEDDLCTCMYVCVCVCVCVCV
jgi:hypothetical protein